MGRVYKFTANISEKTMDVPYLESLPIFDEYKEIVGAFVLKDHDTLAGFVAGNGYPLALTVSLGDSLFFTPMEGKTGKIEFAVLTDKSISLNSIKVRAEES
jgi:hypothetical protein